MEAKFEKILLDAPFKVRVENLSELKGSLFKEVYAEALQNVSKIIEDTKGNKENKGTKENSEGKSEVFYSDIKDYNNIIAFTGDRGTGKTSAMISFAKALENINLIKNDDTVLYNEFIKIKNAGYRFTCLNVIEPSNFIKTESLFEIVIASMFSQISNMVKDCRNVDKNELKDIYKVFDNVYSALKTMYSSKKDLLDNGNDIGSGLEALEQLSVGENLKKSFGELLTLFLKMHIKCANVKYDNDESYDNEIKKTFLVIPIDDLDMNMYNGFEMAEEIRKYLVTKNVIVTMAINIGQFTRIIQQEYIKSFKELYDKGLMNEDPSDMAIKYLTKFIPTNRRIALPTFNVQSLATIKDNDGSLVDYFLEKIYRTTGIMLLKNTEKSHEIIPANLRELNYLNRLLIEMEEIVAEKDGVNILYRSIDNADVQNKLKRNLEKFEDYLIGNFINSNMPSLYSTILLEFIKQDSGDMNKYLTRALIARNDDFLENKKVINLRSSIRSVDSNGQFIKQIMMEITSPDALPQNISIGDVLFVLQQLVIQSSDNDTKRFVAGIKIVYSIRMIKHIFVEEAADDKARGILGEFLYNTEDSELIPLKREMVNVPNIRQSSDSKEWLENSLFNFLISRYAKMTKANGIISRSAHGKKYYAAYKYPYAGGATNNIVINLTSFILNLLDTKVVESRVEESGVFIEKPKGYDAWRKTHIAVIPLWSIDFIDTFFNRIRKKSALKKTAEYRYFDHVEEFFEGIAKTIGNIIDENIYLATSKLLNAYTGNPVLSPDKLKSPDVKKIIDQLGKWWSNENHDKEAELDTDNEGNGEKETKKENKRDDYTNTKPKDAIILGEIYIFKNWAELLTTLVGRLCDQDPQNYLLMEQSKVLKRLNISSVEIVDKQVRRKLISKTVTDKYIKTNFNANDIHKFCKLAMEVTGNNENDFKVVSIHGEE